ncbi:DUF4387 family protein (plasmid) [Rhodococcus globerulus]|uniref:DUF4387 family protein n=1 Tax=Rhodococcus globerulus TaxID=33008 RepID=UPI0039E89012
MTYAPGTFGHIATDIRSKNAGPFWLTIDIFCDEDSWTELTAAEVIAPDRIARLYSVTAEDVNVYLLPELLVIKISFPRPVRQAGPTDRDLHAGQQFVLLAETEVHEQGAGSTPTPTARYA